MLGVIQAEGVNARTFLQGQLSCDMKTVTPEKTCLGAYCDIKGRVQNIFQVIALDETHFLLLAQKDTIAHSVALLSKYARFSKVNMTDVSMQYVSHVWSELFAAPALTRIKQGLPMIYPQTQGLFLPHPLNLVALNAISFNKGCYLGQEIVARTQFRGKVKKHAVYVQAQQQNTPEMGHFIDATQPQWGEWVEVIEVAPNNYAGLAIMADDYFLQTPEYVFSSPQGEYVAKQLFS